MVTIDDIHNAADAIAGHVIDTPCKASHRLSEMTGAEVILKFENHQFTGSFKDRGALFKLLNLSPRDRKIGVIAMSAGNHAQAVAYHAQKLGIPATIVMPRHTPDVKIERTKGFGAEVLLHGTNLHETTEYALGLKRDRGLLLIHPYDDDEIIAGQGTIALEMLGAFPDLECLVIPIGGGGLIAGNAVAAKAINPNIDLIGVQTERFPSMLQSIQGLPIRCETSTIADGIAVKEPGDLTLPLVKEYVDEILLVNESHIEEAVLMLLEVEKTVVEGAGAVGLAALLSNPQRFEGRRTGLLLSGGNIGLLRLSSIIQRGLVRSGRLVRLQVGIPDVPGALADVTRLLGEAHANIVEIRHQRAFTDLSLRLADVEFVIQALGRDHLREILAVLTDSGYQVSSPDIKTGNM
ncbi:MAG: threonine ammonia-lyase [Desulfatiglans sp.]|jgi:threonine dehydratase|nr:threonine ammonia-lyase [Thermodesulfobacteriota bacterium]MEE4352710.1 threonine ammonia-lyase [Desulfatiglans sp.]